MTRGHGGAASVPFLGMTPDAGVQERYSSSRLRLAFLTCDRLYWEINIKVWGGGGWWWGSGGVGQF